MPSWEDLELNWLVAPSIVVGESLKKCPQRGKDAAIGNQGHEAGASFDLNIPHIEQFNSLFFSRHFILHNLRKAKPTTVVNCPDGSGVVLLGGVVVVLFGGMGAGVT